MIDITKYEAILVDLDGTLVDTSRVNYLSYEEAVKQFGYHIEYDYFKKNCNGRHYLDFLPRLTTNDSSMLEKMHQLKKLAYSHYLSEARINTELVELLNVAHVALDGESKRICKTGLVTTASRINTMELLNEYRLAELFDIIITQEDVSKKKPDPEGYVKAMKTLAVLPEKTLIFEDSDIGVEAAQKAGTAYIKVKIEDE